MSPLDVALLAGVLVLCGGWSFSNGAHRAAMRFASLALIALTAAQLATEGAYWHFAPTYLLVMATAIFAIPRTANLTPAMRVGVAGLALIAIAPWMLFSPAPRMTPPNGPYAVGTEIYRWVDFDRAEPSTSDPTDRRNVIVQAWYPTTPGSRGARADYIDGMNHLPPSVAGVPRAVMAHYRQIDTLGILSAPTSAAQAKWPVVLFLPGYGAPRAFYTSLVASLASRGYVVLAIDHPYEAAVTELADGRTVTMAEHFLPNDPDRTSFMLGRLRLRTDDVSFVLDQLGRPTALKPELSRRLDLEHIAAVGHSFGGAASGAAMDRDNRIRAAANIDGTLYGFIADHGPQRPFLLIESDRDETRHSKRYDSGNRQFFARFGGGYRYEIKRANHFSFTDGPLFLALPARFAVAQFIGGGRGPSETHRATVEILDAFLQGPLGRKPARVEVAASHYAGIVGGPTKASSEDREGHDIAEALPGIRAPSRR